MREQEGLAALALEKLGVALDAVRAAIEKKIGRGDQPVEEEIDYVPQLARCSDLRWTKQSDRKCLRSHRAYPAGNGALWWQYWRGYSRYVWVLGKVRAQVFELLG